MTNGHSTDHPGRPWVRFSWLRETAPGHIEHDGGLRIPESGLMAALLGIHPAQQRTSAGPSVSAGEALAAVSGDADFNNLPQWARRRLAAILGPLSVPEQRAEAARNAAVLMDVAARITAAAGSLGGIDVHLPYLDRRNWANRFETLAGTRFVRWQGRIVPGALLEGTRLHEYNAQWLAVASVDPATNTEITFAHRHVVPTALVRPFLPVATEFTLPANPTSAVEIRQTLGVTACRAWNSAPVETSGPYFEVHSQASMAMQSAIRRWFAWHWFKDLSRFDNVSDASVVLAYLVSRPCAGNRRTDFTYDMLADEWLHKAFQFSRRPLKQVLHGVFSTLKATGNTRLALQFQPEQARKVIERARKQPRALRGILAAEGQVVNHMLKFGVALRSATNAFEVANFAPDYAQGLASRLKHLFREQDLSWFTTGVMMEGTSALWTAMGGAPAITTTVSISEAGGSQHLPALSCPPVDRRSQPAPPQC